MTIIEQRTYVCECDACHAQTTLTLPATSYPRADLLPPGWVELPKDPPQRERHRCPAYMTGDGRAEETTA